MPQLPTLIQANHVPITMYMGMMSIIASHFTQSYGKDNHITLNPCSYKVLLDFGVQPLMLGKVVIDGFGLTNVDFDPCPYQILACMGGSEKARGLTK